MDIIGVGAIIAALCIVSLLIRGTYRAGTFPSNARLLCDAWMAVERKMAHDDTVSTPNEGTKSIKQIRGINHA
jgi:hypothetical protein